MNELLTRSLKITLCSITLLASNQNSNAKTVAFHQCAPLPVCFPPSPPRNPIHAAICRISKRSTDK